MRDEESVFWEVHMMSNAGDGGLGEERFCNDLRVCVANRSSDFLVADLDKKPSYTLLDKP